MTPDDGQLKSELLLDELKNRKRTKEIVDVEKDKVKVVVFKSGAYCYAFYGRDVREIIPASEISWVPGLPDYLPGLINVRGDIESVVDIRHFLGEEKKGSAALIAILVQDDFQTGVLIDSIEDVIDLPQDAVEPPLATLDGPARELVTGVFEYNGSTISLLDVRKLAAMISL